jgi:hypothetical protein
VALHRGYGGGSIEVVAMNTCAATRHSVTYLTTGVRDSNDHGVGVGDGVRGRRCCRGDQPVHAARTGTTLCDGGSLSTSGLLTMRRGQPSRRLRT